MQKKDCFLLGTVFKLHGYKGDVNIYNDKNILLDFNTLKYFLIEKESILVPFFIIKARATKSNIILANFEDIDSEKKAFSILNRKVYLPINLLPENHKEVACKNEIIGFKVLDANIGMLGQVSYIDSQTPQKLIYVRQDGKEFCFPMHENFITDIDIKYQTIKVRIPEELINLN